MQPNETVFMFSGQGSHYFQMGQALYHGDQTFHGWMNRLDVVARQRSGSSITETLYAGQNRRADTFDRTLLTHPAIFMVEYSLAQSLMQSGIKPDMVLGVSLGSFAAAAIAGFVSAEDALAAVIQQAIALEQYCEPGGMIAVLANPAIFTEDFISSRSELAAVNMASHFVVSARYDDLVQIEADLRKREMVYQRLPVSFAFHSKWIDNAKASFEAFMHSIPRKSGTLPMICSDQTKVLHELSLDFFWNIVRRPIRFREIPALLEQRGVCRYIDVGPAGTLATFLRYGASERVKTKVFSILTPFGTDLRNREIVLRAGEAECHR